MKTSASALTSAAAMDDESMMSLFWYDADEAFAAQEQQGPPTKQHMLVRKGPMLFYF
jgi:hypothetical protein